MTTRAWIAAALTLGSALTAGLLACLGEDVSPEVAAPLAADAGETADAAGPSCAGQPFTESRAIQVQVGRVDVTSTPPPRPFGLRAFIDPPALGFGRDAGPELLIGEWFADGLILRGATSVDVPGGTGVSGIAQLAGDTVLFAREYVGPNDSLSSMTSVLVTARLSGSTLSDVVEQGGLNGGSTAVTSPWVVGAPPSAVYFARSDRLPDEPPLFRAEVSMQGGVPTFGEPKSIGLVCTAKLGCSLPVAPADERTLFYLAVSQKPSFALQYDTFESRSPSAPRSRPAPRSPTPSSAPRSSPGSRRTVALPSSAS